MSTFLDTLKAALTALALEDRHILLAVSGGADSVALLRGMLALRDEHRLRLSAAHLNHNLRGDQSRADAAWLEALCGELGVPITVGSEDVPALAEGTGRGIEETARDVRYAFLGETASRLGCTHLAVAHTADDLAETILHHVLRGTGIAGLRGIPRSRRLNVVRSLRDRTIGSRSNPTTLGRCPDDDDILLIRPLLDISRKQVESFLAELGQDFCEDVTNVDLSQTRNRMRHSLLPLLRREFNPQIDEALRRLGRQAEEAQATLEQIAAGLLDQAVIDRGETVCRLTCEPLAGHPRHLVRECLSLLWKRLGWPRQKMGFTEWDRLAELVETGGRATLPGNIEAERRGRLLVLRVGGSPD